MGDHLDRRSSSIAPRHSRQSSYSTSMAGDSIDANEYEDGRSSRTPNKQTQTRRQQSKSTVRHQSVHQPDEETSSEEFRQASDEGDADGEVPAHELTLKERQNVSGIESFISCLQRPGYKHRASIWSADLETCTLQEI